jgi:hypothetical protein
MGGFLEGMTFPGKSDKLALGSGLFQGLVQFPALGDRDADVGLSVEYQDWSGNLVGKEDGRALQENMGLPVRRGPELVGKEQGNIACALHGKQVGDCRTCKAALKRLVCVIVQEVM